MSERLRANLLFALLCWTWGSTWLAIKIGLNGVPPVVGASLRMSCSGILLLLLATALNLRWPKGRVFVAQIVIQGTGQFGLNFALVYWAEQTVPSGLASVLFAISPIVTGVLAALLFRIEQFSLRGMVGLIVGLFGVAVIYWSEVIKAAHAPPLGVAAVLCASVLVSLASICAKRWSEGIPPLAMAAPGQLFGGVLLASVAFFTERGQPVAFAPTSLASIAYLAIVGSSIAFLAYFSLLANIQVTKLSLIGYVTPIVAVILGSLVLHEHLATRTFLGAAFVFAGIALMYQRTPLVELDVIADRSSA